MPEDFIIRQGQKPQQLFILAQGSCEVLVKDQTKKDKFVKDLGPGQLFGEVALLYKTKRTASVRCKDECTVGEISEECFLELMQNYPDLHQYLSAETRKYNDHWKEF